MSDFQYALRSLLKSLGFSIVAVVTLALGIDGNALMFGRVDSLVLHPFPYPEPDRLVAMGVNFPPLAAQGHGLRSR